MNIEKIDRYISFLRNEAERLEDIGKDWATSKMGTFSEIAELLRQVRQDHQMRGLSGKRIDT